MEELLTRWGSFASGRVWVHAVFAWGARELNGGLRSILCNKRNAPRGQKNVEGVDRVTLVKKTLRAV